MFTKIEEWISLAREKVKSEGVRQNDLDQLEQILQVKCSRQRLLYLQATTPSIRSNVIGMAQHEPVNGAITQIEPDTDDWKYQTVHDAIVDGWQAGLSHISNTTRYTEEIDKQGQEIKRLTDLITIQSDAINRLQAELELTWYQRLLRKLPRISVTIKRGA